MSFYPLCDHRLLLCNDNITAIRNFGFRNGILIGSQPLIDNEPFEVKLEVLLDSGDGCLDIGVTTINPADMEVPASAISLRDSAWILSGNRILHDGTVIDTNYGPDLGRLTEGDNLAVMRTSSGELSFYLNGQCLGVAATNMPERLYPIVDLCGKSAQVSINTPAIMAATLTATSSGIPIDLGACAVASVDNPGASALRDSWRFRSVPPSELIPVYLPEEQSEWSTLSVEAAASAAGADLSAFPFSGCDELPAPEALIELTPDGDTPPPPQTTVTPPCQADNSVDNKESLLSEDLGAVGFSSLTSVQVDNLSMSAVDEALANQDRLRFHPRCGILVNLSNNNKTAERCRPLDDYNNGVVMSHRPLFDGELFEIRIDRLIDKWSGSIEVGVTSHNPETVRFPNTMTNMDSGTVMMSGCKVLVNGHGTGSEYGYSNLDELREGDTVGMIRTSSGKLHFLVNGIDQGVAVDKADPQIWAVIDLYGMTVKVTIIDHINDGNAAQSGAFGENHLSRSLASRLRPRIDEDSLLFHTLRDSDVVILNDGKTAHRPNAFEYFHNGIVMTNRTLKTNELFQVRLDTIIPKWAGSIEIGVTQHQCNEIIFPFKMSNARSGTWAMTGEDVVRDGTVIMPQYVSDLNKLVEGDTVGVMRKEMGILHFFVNGVDQGMAAFNVPEQVYGIIDLYGRVGQATIVENHPPPPAVSPESPISTDLHGVIYPELCFHRVHGHNVQLKRTRLTAKRHNVYSEFSDAVLFSSRPLRECEMFEIRIDHLVDCWIGSLEIGVTAILPEELEGASQAERASALSGTADEHSWNTYILSGSSVMKDGECVLNNYPLDLDKLVVGSRVGLMWHADRSLHFYQDGLDMGRSIDIPHLNIYAVVDIYGQCTQVSIIQNEERGFNHCHSDNSALANLKIYVPPSPCFSEYHGDNVWMSRHCRLAMRGSLEPSGALVFSSTYLRLGELFQIKVMRCRSPCQGSLRVGLTDINILNAHVNRNLPNSVTLLPHFTTYVEGEYIKCSSATLKEHETLKSVEPSFDFLRPGDIVALKKVSTSKVEIYFNYVELDVAFEDVPDKVYVVAEMFGNCTAIKTITKITATPPIANSYEEEHDPDCSGNHREYCPMMKSEESTTTGNVAAEEAFGAIAGEGDAVGADVADLVSDRAEPVADRVDPIADRAEPVADRADLVSDRAESVADRAEPVADRVAPNVNRADPSSDRSDPASGRADLASARADPASDRADLASDRADPASDRADAASDRAVPTVDGTTSPADQVVPAAGKLAPAADGSSVTSSSAGSSDTSITDGMAQQHATIKSRPFTFHEICGENIELCSSDTVAIREYSYDKALVFISHPLELGNTCHFRVDKLEEEWSGSVMLGAVAALPDDEDDLPDNALNLEGECWVMDHQFKNIEGTVLHTRVASALAGLDEQAVLSLHLSTEHRLEVHIDGDYICTIATIPARFTQLYPLIDLYGPVSQVSTLLHTYKMVHSTSIVFPLVTDAQDYDFFPWKRNIIRPAFSVHEIDDSEDQYSRLVNAIESTDSETSESETSIQEYLEGQETYDEDDGESLEGDWFIEEPEPGPVGQPLEQLMVDTVAPKLEIPDHQSVEKTIGEPVGLFVDLTGQKPIVNLKRQIITLPNDQSVIQPAGQSILQNEQSVVQSIQQQIQLPDQPLEGGVKSTVQPVGQLERTFEPAIAPFVDKFSLDLCDQPIDQATGQSSEHFQPIQESIKEPLQDLTQPICSDDSVEMPMKEDCANVGDTTSVLTTVEVLLGEHESSVIEQLEDRADEQAEQILPQPVPSTSRDEMQLLQVLTQSALGAERRRTSLTPNDVYNRQIQSTMSNNSFFNDILNADSQTQGSHGSMASSVVAEQVVPSSGPSRTIPPQRRPFDFNQQPHVLRENRNGAYIDIMEQVNRDPNVRHNSLFPELNDNTNLHVDDDSLDSEELMHVLSESNNWPDLNEDRSSSGENEATNASESFGRREVEVHRYVNSNFGYLKNLIYYNEEPFYRVEYDLVEFDGSVATCEYLHTVLKYWRDLIPHYPENRQSIMWGNVECYCTHCNSAPEPFYSGWVRIRRNLSPPLPQADRVFWNVDGSLLRWVLLSDANTFVRASTNRPSSLQIMPSTAPYFSTLWFDEERKPLRACSAIEIERNYDEHVSTDSSPTLDRMVSLMLRLEPPVPNTDEDQMPCTLDDDDDFE